MDQLRENYDAVLASPWKRMESNVVIRQQRTVTDATDTPLPSVGWLLLVLSGIVDVRPGRLWQLLSHWHVVDASLLAVALGYLGAYSNLHHFPAITTACYLLGTMIAILGVRHAGITAMIGPYERHLDEYAADYGFTEDWRQLSRYRLAEVLVFWCLMMACRILAALLSSEEIFGGLPLSSFGTGMVVLVAHLLMSLRLSAVCYTHFHVCSGLELAIDNFCLRLFKDQDMEGALSEWNVLSATQASFSEDMLVAVGAGRFLHGISCSVCLPGGADASNPWQYFRHCAMAWMAVSSALVIPLRYVPRGVRYREGYASRTSGELLGV